MSAIYLDSLERRDQGFRILTLLPGSGTTRIETMLNHVLLSNKPEYEAISYAWGSPDDTNTVLVNGIDMLVPSNLELCLQYLRKPDEALHLWADSICINQQNTRERERQVGMMGEIFRSCTSTYVWLGVPSVQGINPSSSSVLLPCRLSTSKTDKV